MHQNRYINNFKKNNDACLTFGSYEEINFLFQFIFCDLNVFFLVKYEFVAEKCELITKQDCKCVIFSLIFLY